MKGLPGLPDAVISNAALGSATVEQYEPDLHKQDLAMLQVSNFTLCCNYRQRRFWRTSHHPGSKWIAAWCEMLYISMYCLM